jgi:hypothetical protein
MKKGLLLLIGLMTLASVSANDFKNSTTTITITNGYDETVTFIERGVEFHVFLNGDFEFTNPNKSRYYNYNENRFSSHSFKINRDYKGRIKRIGRNYIRYDFKGNVTRIGNIRLHYRNGLLRKVGHLKISYNDWGDPFYHGEVKYNNDYYDDNFHFSINIGSIFNYNDRYFHKREFKNNYRKFKEDRNFYYYKARPNAKIGKRNKVIKRRKSTTKTRKNNVYQKRKNVKRDATTNRNKPDANTQKNYRSNKKKVTPRKVITTRKRNATTNRNKPNLNTRKGYQTNKRKVAPRKASKRSPSNTNEKRRD